MSELIKYTSDNGYTGVLYGESSLSIKDKNGKEVFHTGFRNINTYKELVECVEDFPEFHRILQNLTGAIRDDFLNGDDDDNF